MVVSSGKPFTYYADDQDAPFRRVPHFAHWVPMAGPSHLLIVKRGEKPRLVRHAPEDYWYEQAPLGSPFWVSPFEIVECGSAARVWASFPKDGTFAYVGDEPDAARAAGVSADALNPKSLIARLDWDRSSKTPYEVACLEEATARAADGHRVARTAFDGVPPNLKSITRTSRRARRPTRSCPTGPSSRSTTRARSFTTKASARSPTARFF
jgi:Xaa-Pro dipeptidase